jgi:hypothetical protein
LDLHLSDDQASALSDVLDAWLDGYEEATKQVEEDRTFETPEEYLRAMSGMHEGFDLISSIRGMLPVGVTGGN